jgi:hypothetical protein
VLLAWGTLLTAEYLHKEPRKMTKTMVGKTFLHDKYVQRERIKEDCLQA